MLSVSIIRTKCAQSMGVECAKHEKSVHQECVEYVHLKWQAERGGKNRRPSVKESTFYVDWGSEKHSIFTSYQALMFSTHGIEITAKIEASSRIDCAYFLVDAARPVLKRERFVEFRRQVRSLISDQNFME